MATKQPEQEKIPTWLFMAIYEDRNVGEIVDGKVAGKGWNEAKEQLARRIMKHLKGRAEAAFWPKEVLEKVLYFNKHDDYRGYYVRPK